jgi:hypothetical protein
MTRTLHASLLVAILTGCGADTTSSTDHAISFETEVAPHLRLECATCHQSSSPAGGLILDGRSDDIVAHLVGVQANSSSLNLVEPGLPDQSFIVLKLRGDFSAARCGANGCGAKMPSQGAFDPTAEGHLIHWITDGAQLDGAL